MATSLSDIHSDIIHKHILPKLDGPSLSTTAAVSSNLKSLCSDHNLWSPISKSTWPSITDPHVNDVISTFPAGRRSFFQDSFPTLTTNFNDLNNCPRKWSMSKSSDCMLSRDLERPSQLISTVDIRYQNDIIYSRVEFTDTTADFLSSTLWIELNNDSDQLDSKDVHGLSQSIDLKVDELAGPNEATLSHLKESLTINWILINPNLRRSGNLSSVKPVSAKIGWRTYETVLQYVTVLSGCDPNEMVECRIQVVLGVGIGGVGLHVKKVILKLLDLDCNCLNGKDFLVITQGAILEENNVIRKVMNDAERWKCHKRFKEMKKEKKEWVKREEEKREFAIKMNYIAILLSFLSCLYSLNSLLL